MCHSLDAKNVYFKPKDESDFESGVDRRNTKR